MDKIRRLDAEELRTWRSLLVANRLLFERVQHQLRQAAGLPHSYFDILSRLCEAPERRLRMSELAANSQSSPSRLSHAVARMEEAGWVRRLACTTDRRAQFAELTDAGFQRLESAASGHVEEVRSLLFDVLSPQQQRALREISDATADGIAGRALSERAAGRIRRDSSGPTDSAW